MPQEIRLWSIDDGRLESLKNDKLDLEDRLEGWIVEDVSIISPDLLVIGKQVETEFGGYMDVLCLDPDGNVVILELKRDKTPREVTAQILDYASWVEGLSHDQIRQVAAKHFGTDRSLDDKFRERFDTDLPEVLNESHRLMVVGAALDSATERIIQYLSETHGVSINAATFQYFRDGSAERREFLARAFLLEPDRVEYQTRTKKSSKRQRWLTLGELEALADENGVRGQYERLVSGLGQFKQNTTRSSIRVLGEFSGRKRVVLSFLPGESDPARGLRFQVYIARFCEMCGLSLDEALQILPADREEWSYGSDPEWSGYAGYFHGMTDVETFLGGLEAG